MTDYATRDAPADDKASPDSPDEMFERLKKRVREAHSNLADWYKEAREDFEFSSGHQWDEKTIEKLQEQLRPASTFNLVGPMVKAVSGYEVVNRQETRYIPRRLGASGTAEVVSAAAKYFRDNTDAEDAESAAFRNAVTCGLGWLETYIDFDENQDGDYIKRIVPVFEMIWDAKARDPNLTDAKWVARVRTMTCEEAAELFPDVDYCDLDASWLDMDDGKDDHHHDDPTNRYSDDGKTELYSDDREVKVIDCQWWEMEPFFRIVDPGTGRMADLSEADFNKLNERLMVMGMPGIRGVQQRRKVYKRAFLGKQILGEVTQVPAEKWFTYQAITGDYDETKGMFFGIVRPMKDPQRWTNKLFSQTMHILNTSANGGIMFEAGAFEDERKALSDWAKPNTAIKTTPNALQSGRVQPKPQTQVNPAFFSLTEFTMGMGPRVTGINLEFLGMRQADQAGVLEHQRRQSAVTILATLFDSLRLYRKREGRQTLRLIQLYLSDERLIRVVGEEGQMFLPLSRDKTAGEYEVVVDDAPWSPNQKEKNWQIIQSMLPMLGKIMETNPQLIAELAKYSPLPEALGQKIAQAMSKGPDPEAQAAQKAEKFAEINKTNSESEKNRALALQALSETFVQPLMAPAMLQPLDGPFPVQPPGGSPMPPPGMLQPPQGMPPSMPQMMPHPGLPPMGGPMIRPPMPGAPPPMQPAMRPAAPPMLRPPMPPAQF